MERVQVLIDKLVEQKQQRVPAAQLLATVRLLEKELLALQQREVAALNSKVTVVMPSNNSPRIITDKVDKSKFTEKAPAKKPEEVKPAESPYMPKEEPVLAQPDFSMTESYRPIETAVAEVPVKKPVQHEPVHLPFDPVEETPTLVQHQPEPSKEVFQLKIEPEEPQSLNDKLKQNRVEVAHVLKDTPIRDLRKAIGINDKFVFVSELFRDDEAMYDRSIKTINSFNILPEAEYWINRELKVKLGWNDSKEVVQHFYQLVRRRFS